MPLSVWLRGVFSDANNMIVCCNTHRTFNFSQRNFHISLLFFAFFFYFYFSHSLFHTVYILHIHAHTRANILSYTQLPQLSMISFCFLPPTLCSSQQSIGKYCGTHAYKFVHSAALNHAAFMYVTFYVLL